MSFAGSLIALLGAAILGQQQTPQIDPTALALNWLLGRYRMPVTCVLPDGAQIEREEAVVIKLDLEQGVDTLRATFFGIDAGEATHCYNLLHSELPDRRGTLYLTYRSTLRTDIGMSDFRHMLKDGELSYHIPAGRLALRPIGETQEAAGQLDLRGASLEVKILSTTSDGYRMLGRYPDAAPRRIRGGQMREPRRIEMRIEPREGEPVSGFYLEDPRRWR